VLLTGAGLLLRSYARVLTTDRGFRPDGLVTVTLDLPEGRYRTRASQSEFMKNAAAHIASVPGVTRVLIASGVPPAGGLIFGELEVEGHEKAPGGAAFGGGFVEPGFFETLRIPVRHGRTFRQPDLQSGAVIINEGTAARYWPGGSALGKRLRLGSKDAWNTIVGVVGDVDMDHGEAGGVQLYFPLADPSMAGDTTILVATSLTPSEVIPALKARIWTLDPRLALDNVESVEQAVRKVMARPRFNVVLLTIFAGIGLLLAMIGVYGVVSYSVGLRTREIGVRMALGAVPSTIARSIVGEALVLAAIGVLLGLAGAMAGAQLMQKLLFEISPTDPVTLGGVAVVLAATAVVAALLPARRAMRVDPLVALRTE
jgi:putative ABC transport system permease protein